MGTHANIICFSIITNISTAYPRCSRSQVAWDRDVSASARTTTRVMVAPPAGTGRHRSTATRASVRNTVLANTARNISTLSALPPGGGIRSAGRVTVRLCAASITAVTR